MLEQQLIEYISRNFGVDRSEFDTSTDLAGAGILDSFSIIELVTYIESIAAVKFDAFDLAMSNLESIDAIKNFVERKKNK
jgi:acyl carrier protein